MSTRAPSPVAGTAVATVVLLILVAIAVAADPAPPAESVTETGLLDAAAIDRARLQVPAPAPRTLHERVVALIDARDAKIAALRADFENAATEEEALAVQRAIERVGLVTEAAVLHTQLELARERADTESAARLEASLAVLDPDGEIAAEIAAADPEVDR